MKRIKDANSVGCKSAILKFCMDLLPYIIYINWNSHTQATLHNIPFRYAQALYADQGLLVFLPDAFCQHEIPEKVPATMIFRCHTH